MASIVGAPSGGLGDEDRAVPPHPQRLVERPGRDESAQVGPAGAEAADCLFVHRRPPTGIAALDRREVVSQPLFSVLAVETEISDRWGLMRQILELVQMVG